MLSLKPLFTVNRVTVFGDHADPNQFYYLPETVHLSTDSSGKPAFTLMKYMRDITDNPAFSEGQQLGGGFLIFSVDLGLDDDTRAQITSRARRFSEDTPQLVTALFREGTVRVVSLDSSDPAGTGRPRFVETVYGTTTPSLLGDQQATFSLELSQEGVALMEQAFLQGGTPIGVVYELKFLGLRPAFDVTVKADYKRIYDEWGAQFAAQGGIGPVMIRAEVDLGWQKLIENNAIQVTVNSLSDDADSRQQRDLALRFFLDSLMQKFFQSSLQVPTGATQSLVNNAALPGMAQAGRSLNQVTGGAPPVAGAAGQFAQSLAGQQGIRPTAAPGSLPPSANPLASQLGAAGLLTGASAPNRPGPALPAPLPGPLGAPIAAPSPGPVPPSPVSPAPPGPTVPGPVPPSGSTPPPATPGPAASRPPTPVTLPGAPPPAGAQTPRPTTPAPSGGGGGAAGITVGFTLKHVEQTELKTFEMSWKEASAAEQTHAPNGSFGIMMRGLNRAEHFLAINLDDPFFQRLKLSIDCPTPFSAIGLSVVQVHVEYGDDGTGQPFYMQDVELKPDAQGHVTPQLVTCSLDSKRTLGYKYRVELFFDPSDAIRAQKMHYSTDLIPALDRSLIIDPSTYVGLLEVDAVVGDLNFDEIVRAQVKIGYDDDSNNFHVQDTFSMSKDKPTFTWQVRLSDPSRRQYWYEVTYFLKGDQTIVRPRVAGSARNLVINEPWEDRFNLLVDAALTHNTARLVVELNYEDTAAGYRFTQVQRIVSDKDIPVSVSIPVLDRGNRSYHYRVTSVTTDNNVHRGDIVQGTDTYLLVSPPGA